jgi:hypothetical protein
MYEHVYHVNKLDKGVSVHCSVFVQELVGVLPIDRHGLTLLRRHWRQLYFRAEGACYTSAEDEGSTYRFSTQTRRLFLGESRQPL